MPAISERIIIPVKLCSRPVKNGIKIRSPLMKGILCIKLKRLSLGFNVIYFASSENDNSIESLVLYKTEHNIFAISPGDHALIPMCQRQINVLPLNLGTLSREISAALLIC